MMKRPSSMNNIFSSWLTFLFCVFVQACWLSSASAESKVGLAQCRQLDKNTAEISTINTDAFFWRIEKAGVDSSYLFGTIHVSDERVLQQANRVLPFLVTADSFVMELDPDPAGIAVFQEKMFFNENHSLQQLIADDLFQATVFILERYHYDADTVARMKPWAAYLTMNYPADNPMFLDKYLMLEARSHKLEIHGLETAEEQLALFNVLGLEDQIQLLLDSVCHFEKLEQDFARLIEYYLEHSPALLYEYSMSAAPNEPLYQNLLDDILTKRNILMAKRLNRFFKRGNIFAAVGALHLPGENGLIKLLRQQGYTVTPMKQ